MIDYWIPPKDPKLYEKLYNRFYNFAYEREILISTESGWVFVNRRFPFEQCLKFENGKLIDGFVIYGTSKDCYKWNGKTFIEWLEELHNFKFYFYNIQDHREVAQREIRRINERMGN